MTNDAQPPPKHISPTPAVPSPQMFARPAPLAEHDNGEPRVVVDDAAADDRESRFAGTGDLRVDRALAQLPDPAEHRRETEGHPADRSAVPDSAGRPGAAGDDNNHVADDGKDDGTVSGIDLPDPGLLDAHLADVTSVHRQLQQRLSDLSG